MERERAKPAKSTREELRENILARLDIERVKKGGGGQSGATDTLALLLRPERRKGGSVCMCFRVLLSPKLSR